MLPSSSLPSCSGRLSAAVGPQGLGLWQPWQLQRRYKAAHTCHSASKDLSAGLVETVANLALRSRLRSYRDVKSEVSCDTWSLVTQGRLNGVKIRGEGWVSPLNLTAQVLEASVGQVFVDLGAMLAQQRIVLANVPVGTARAVFSSTDLGNFLEHPLVTTAAKGALMGFDFKFEAKSVRIEAPSSTAPAGVVELAGSWGGDRQRYQLQLQPVLGGAAVGRAVEVLALPLTAGGRPGAATQLGEALTRFFNSLTLDLEGAEMSFQSMNIIPGTGFAGSLAELNLRLVVRRFPPLNVKF